MKILMLNPPFLRRYSRQSRSPCVTKGGTFYYPYFLAYATGVLEKNNFDVKLIDAIANDWNHEETLDFVKKMNPDLVVLDTSTPSIINDVNFASKIKGILENVHVNLVGTHPTNLPEETLRMSNKIDSVCIWEYDYTVLDLASTIEKNGKFEKVNGLFFRKGKKIIHTKPRALIRNLDELPFVSEVYKKHLKIGKYFYASLRYPQVTILTARGCPYNCSFCNSPFKASYRARSVKNVADEFEYIKSELPKVKEIMIEDETFPAFKERTIEFCDELIRRKNKIKWSCNSRVNTNFETLERMKKAGCRLLCVGFETPNQEVLNAVHKGITKNIQMEFMNNTEKLGLLVNGCFIIGLPYDTKETIKNTIEFAKKLNPDTAQFYPLMVYPGLEIYNWVKKNRYLLTEDYSKWLTPEGWHNCVISTKDLTNEDLVNFADKARLEFYLRPEYFWKRFLVTLKDFGEFKRTLIGGLSLFKYFVKLFSGKYEKSRGFGNNTGI